MRTYINMVRKRARFDGTVDRNTLPDYTNLSKEAFRTAVLQERRWEFVAEGQLVRSCTHKYVGTTGTGCKARHYTNKKNYLFPLPQREVDLNPNLVQNPGY